MESNILKMNTCMNKVFLLPLFVSFCLVEAYQEAAYKGKLTAQDVMEFVMKAGYNEYQIEAEKAYFLDGLNK